MNFIRGIRSCNARVLVFPKPRAFSSTVSGHKQPVNHGVSQSPQTNGGTDQSKGGIISKLHDFAEKHSVCYKAASSFLSKRGVVSIVNTDFEQKYFVRWSGFEKKNASVYVDPKCQLVISGSNRSFFGLGKRIVYRRRQFQLPIADYNNAVIDATFHEEMSGVLVDITSFTKPSGEVFKVK